ncbi:MAG: hypothetical protein MKZ95_17220 [Pirellulales bacterium]|nr:hypothetical protein [Pirellulales bacterium]
MTARAKEVRPKEERLGPHKHRGQLIIASLLLTSWILFLAWMAIKG